MEEMERVELHLHTKLSENISVIDLQRIVGICYCTFS